MIKKFKSIDILRESSNLTNVGAHCMCPKQKYINKHTSNIPISNIQHLTSNVAITLIALVITIIVLLILAGVTIITLTGENGLLNRATNASEKTKEAEAVEVIQLQLMSCRTEYILNKSIDIPTYVAKENKEIQTEVDNTNNGDGTPLSNWLMTYNGYTFKIYDLQIQEYYKEDNKIRSSIKDVTVTGGYQFASTSGSKIDITFKVELPSELSGATVSVNATSNATGIIDGNYDNTTGIYTGTITTDRTTNSNGTYTYEVEVTKNNIDYTSKTAVTIDKFLEDPKVEITGNKNDRFTINVTNNYPADANLKYKYYYSTTTTYPTADFETVTSKEITGLSGVTTYNIKVEVYLNDGVTFKEVTTQNTTEDILINLESLSNDNEIYLIKGGKENLVAWNLYNPSNGHSVEYGDGYLSYGGGSPWTFSNYHVNGKVDLTNFQKIVIDAGCNYVGGGCDAYFISTYPYTTGFKDQGDTTGLVRYTQVTESSRKLYEIDVSDLNGYYYIGMSEGYYHLYVYNLYLIRK